VSAAAVLCCVPQLLESAKVGEYQPGQKLDIAGMFKAGDNVDVAGTTVGKGFQGENKQQQQQQQQQQRQQDNQPRPPG
jgi:ribosomal protein L3